MQILGIALSHKFSQKSFAESLKLPYPLLSDFPNGETILRYGVQQFHGKAGRLFSRQAFILVDKAGTVRGVWVVRDKKAGETGTPDLLFASDPILKVARKIAAE